MRKFGDYDSIVYQIAKEQSVEITKRIFNNNRFMQRVTGVSGRRQENEMISKGLAVGRTNLKQLVKDGTRARALNVTTICLFGAYWGMLGIYMLMYDFELSGLPVGIPARGLVAGDHWKHKPVNRVTSFLKDQLIPQLYTKVDKTN